MPALYSCLIFISLTALGGLIARRFVPAWWGFLLGEAIGFAVAALIIVLAFS